MQNKIMITVLTTVLAAGGIGLGTFATSWIGSNIVTAADLARVVEPMKQSQQSMEVTLKSMRRTALRKEQRDVELEINEMENQRDDWTVRDRKLYDMLVEDIQIIRAELAALE